MRAEAHKQTCGRPRGPSLGWRLRHYGVANARDVRALLREFRWTLALFAALFAAGSLLVRLFYRDPVTGSGLDLGEAAFAVFCLVFVQPTIPFPEAGALRALFFLVPVLGLGLLGEGMVRFGVLLFDKRARREAWQVALASTFANHVVVCGVGRLGFRVVEQLLDCGEDVVAVEINPEDPFLDAVRERRVPVILGDARRKEVLAQAGVARAQAIIPCTENDLANLEIALDARELKPGIKVVLRMFDQDLAEKVKRGFDIPTAFSTSALAAPAFAAAATQIGISHALNLGGVPLRVAQMRVAGAPALAGRTVGQVERDYGLSIILLERKTGVDLHPAPAAVLRDGDGLAILATPEALKRIRRENGEAGE